MKRRTFLAMASCIALLVGMFAVVAPGVLLESKGVTLNAGTIVWMREVGVLLVAMGITAFLIRGHEDSPTLKAFLIGNIVVQLGLLTIEPIAYANGVITKLSGIVPNTVLHVLLAGGFAFYAVQIRKIGKVSGYGDQRRVESGHHS